jgi:hypothetical protein
VSLALHVLHGVVTRVARKAPAGSCPGAHEAIVQLIEPRVDCGVEVSLASGIQEQIAKHGANHNSGLFGLALICRNIAGRGPR